MIGKYQRNFSIGIKIILWEANKKKYFFCFSSDGSRPASALPPPTAPTPTPSIHSIHPEPPQSEPPQSEEPPPEVDQTTLIRNEDESFALAPVDTSVLKGVYLTCKY